MSEYLTKQSLECLYYKLKKRNNFEDIKVGDVVDFLSELIHEKHNVKESPLYTPGKLVRALRNDKSFFGIIKRVEWNYTVNHWDYYFDTLEGTEIYFFEEEIVSEYKPSL